jgi:iron(III) transport system ATP-binding protein
MTGLKLEHISHWFGLTQALDDVGVHIEESEFVAILGPSGCGKTTLLRVIGGFLRPSKGVVGFGDRIWSSPLVHVPVERRDLGMVFQSFALWPHMSVRAHVEFPLKSARHRNLGPKERKERIDRTLEATGLESLQHRLPGELSGGQRQRVSLARAIVSKPSVLLMDEPLSALDQELRVEMRREIQDIHRLTGATVVYVTHDQGEALAMADRLIIMKDGRIEQAGTPRAVYLRPETPFAASFVSKCNFVKGTWQGKNFVVPGNPPLIFDGAGIAEVFRGMNIYPVRPEQFRISKGDYGLEGRIANKLYSGREIHYSVRCQGEMFTVYTDSFQDYRPGESVRLLFEGPDEDRERNGLDKDGSMVYNRTA